MGTEAPAEIILYDLKCTKGVCFSPSVWRTRLLLNYKGIPYKTVFLEFPDIEPTLKDLGIPPHNTVSSPKYTVPAIRHLPTNTYLMDSTPIASFLTSTYPNPSLSLSTERGSKIESLARDTIGPVLQNSNVFREMHILPPRSQEFFSRKLEGFLGPDWQGMFDLEREDKEWKGIDGEIRELSDLIRMNGKEGPFILGGQPSYNDFMLAGSMQCARVIDEGTWERIVAYEGLRQLYEACAPWMERKD